MLHRLEPGCFGDIEQALLEQVRHDALCQAIAEPFMRGLPSMVAPGTHHTYGMLQRRLILLAEARELFREMSPFELQIRALCSIQPGRRKLSR
jgi:hypothetical protein